VFLGVRSLLYLSGHADAGLSQALWMTAVGLLIGVLIGGITRIYDRKGFHRIQGALELAIAAQHQAQHQARTSPREAPTGPKHKSTGSATNETPRESADDSPTGAEHESPSKQT
jgi:predicted lipid-binding transport protein (Tim44 family)